MIPTIDIPFYIEYTESAPMRGQRNNTYTEEHSLGETKPTTKRRLGAFAT